MTTPTPPAGDGCGRAERHPEHEAALNSAKLAFDHRHAPRWIGPSDVRLIVDAYLAHIGDAARPAASAPDQAGEVGRLTRERDDARERADAMETDATRLFREKMEHFDRATAAEATVAALREVIADAMHWHERADKVLSKSGDRSSDALWRRGQHQEQAAVLAAALVPGRVLGREDVEHGVDTPVAAASTPLNASGASLNASGSARDGEARRAVEAGAHHDGYLAAVNDMRKALTALVDGSIDHIIALAERQP